MMDGAPGLWEGASLSKAKMLRKTPLTWKGRRAKSLRADSSSFIASGQASVVFQGREGISVTLHMLGWLGQSSVPSRDDLVFQNVLSCLFLVLVSKCAFSARRWLNFSRLEDPKGHSRSSGTVSLSDFTLNHSLGVWSSLMSFKKKKSKPS